MFNSSQHSLQPAVPCLGYVRQDCSLYAQDGGAASFADGGEDPQQASQLQTTRDMLSINPVRANQLRPRTSIRRDNRLRQGQRRVDGRPAIHWNTACAACGTPHIVGTRYTSTTVADHHMCASCFAKHGHPYPVDASDFAPGENASLMTTVMFSSTSSPLVRTDIGPFGATNLGRTQAPRTVYGYGAGGPPLYSSA